MTTKALLFAAGLVASGSLSAQTDETITATRVIDPAVIAAERLALFEAERDFVMGNADLSPEAVASRKAEFISLNFERIVRHKINERMLAKQSAAGRTKVPHETQEAEVANLLGHGEDNIQQKDAATQAQSKLIRAIHNLELMGHIMPNGPLPQEKRQ